ncbi:MAG: hypothetical protein JKP92_03020 [Alphaproteobacteria bacterium]|jgi:hypothetical protein|nr:hypothetical protein [Alphaproteobacteria bacterium]
MMGPKSFPRIVYITSIKGWVHDYTLLGAGYWSGRIWDRTTIRGGTPYAPKAELDEAVEALRGLYRLVVWDQPKDLNEREKILLRAEPFIIDEDGERDGTE